MVRRFKHAIALICLISLVSCGAEFENNPQTPAIICGVPDLFEDDLWPVMSSLTDSSGCMVCHQPGVIGSILIFNSFDTVEENYNVLRNYVRSGNSDKLLAKTIGDLFHGGSTPFIDSESENYQNLSALIDIMEKDCKVE
jgi:hypothetical protein